MKTRGILFCLLILVFGVIACVESNYFGESNDTDIEIFNIEGQLTNSIEQGTDTGRIYITVPTVKRRDKLKVTGVRLSQLSHTNIDLANLTDFSEPVIFTITAENTKVKKPWKITVGHDEATSQVAFSDMKEWTKAKNANNKELTYKEDGVTKNAYFPGNGTDLSFWQSPAEANGYSLSGINTVTVSPVPNNTNPDFARIETIFVESGAVVYAKAQVVTGALFTGQFKFNLQFAPLIGSNEPRKMVIAGTPFYGRPVSMTLKMRYKPGNKMRAGDGEEITALNANGRPLKDSCDVYALLQNRSVSEDHWVRIATAHMRTSEVIGNMDDENGFIEITIPFTYGKPDAATLAQKPYMNMGGARGELIFYKEPITKTSEPMPEFFAENPSEVDVDYITILCSSSAYGDNFWGAVNEKGGKFRGSTLDVKNIRLNY